MRSFAIVAACSLGLIGGVNAAEMPGADIKALVAGKTIYLDLTGASSTGKAGTGAMYYAIDGSLLYRTPTGVIWTGTWKIIGDTVCNDWKERPNNPCTRYDKTGDTITAIRGTTGETIGKVLKAAPGNAENLSP